MGSTGEKFQILLAEDNAVARKVVSRLLERDGHVVTTACDGIAALQAVVENPFDLVLMDVQMPGLDGLAATEAIREEESIRGGHVWVIALTADDSEEERRRCFEAGMDGFLTKPFQMDRWKALMAERQMMTRVSAPDLGPPPPQKGVGLRLPFDERRLEAQVGGSHELKDEVIHLFLADLPQLWSALEVAVIDRNTTAVCQNAHRLKGALLNMAAAPAASATQAIESAAASASTDLSISSSLLESLRVELSLLEAALRSGSTGGLHA